MAEVHRMLIDVDANHAPDDFILSASDFGRADHAFSIRKRRLHGGLQEGVDVVTIDNGRFHFAVLPTRGMGLWRGWLGDLEVGWQSPIRGPVHPQFVPVCEPGGLGWLDGFDEWLVRCGLVSNGAPEFETNGQLKYPLHGRIANLPASRVELTVDPDQGEIRLSGIVHEARFLFHQLQLRSTIVTRLDQPGLQIIDEVTNLAATPAEAQLLYHINFGAPLLDAGATLVAPVKTLVPREAGAAAGIDRWQTYGAAQPGFAEQVYLLDLWANNDQRTEVLLKSGAGTRGVSLAFNKQQLPCFTLWKNTCALADGYVTGLEPGTNFPNPRSYEGAQGRVVKLKPGETARFDLAMTVHDSAASVAAAEASVATLQRAGEPQIFRTPQRGWTAAAE